MLSEELQKHAAEFARRIRNHDYEVSPAGIHFPAAHVIAAGGYLHDVNGQDERFDPNLLPDEGLIYLLTAGLRNASRYSNWFLSLFAANYTPLANLTAASYPATASEITSQTEGYTETTRRGWTTADPTTPAMDNLASKAAFTIATAGSLVVNGAALHSESAKGATTGKLVSATKFAQQRTLYNTDVFNVAYRVQLAST